MQSKRTLTQRQQHLARAKRRIEARAEIFRLEESRRALAERIKAKRLQLKQI